MYIVKYIAPWNEEKKLLYVVLQWEERAAAADPETSVLFKTSALQLHKVMHVLKKTVTIVANPQNV